MSPSFHHDPVALRRAAEARYHARRSRDKPPAADLFRIRYELEVHQIELEMQNEELITARTALAAELKHYIELYDFAPVGYFTLSLDGTIRRLNLTGAALVGATRAPLMGRRFGLWVAEADRLRFSDFLTLIFTAADRQTCELSLLRAGAEPLSALLEAQRAGTASECRVAVVDISARRQAEAALLQQTEALKVRNAELLRFNRSSVGRELRMIELKQEVNELCRRLGEAPRHAITAPHVGSHRPNAPPASPVPAGGGV